MQEELCVAFLVSAYYRDGVGATECVFQLGLGSLPISRQYTPVSFVLGSFFFSKQKTAYEM